MSNAISAIDLLKNRNSAIGWLLISDRSAAHVAILLVLLRFRENHELEPLHGDILAALSEEVTCDPEQFRADMHQLCKWELVSERIEKERLRGYRDTRRQKFRYRMSDDAVSFLIWLESRYQDDLNPEDADTRDLLADMVASLRETTRLLNKITVDAVDYETARGIFHRLAKMVSATEGVAKSLGDFNIRLLAFAGGSYDIPRARRLIGELDRFLERFIRRVHTLRNEIRPEIEKLRLQRLAARWEACSRVMAEEAAATQTLLRTRIPAPSPTLANLADFYGPGGLLEQLTSRVNKSALLVWQKLHAHLRELDRRSHRLEDIRSRVLDLAQLPAERVPGAWLRDITQSAHMRGDMHEWNEQVKATPPQPVWHKHRVRGEPHIWLEPRTAAAGKPVQSLEERRLEALADWMRGHGVMPGDAETTRLSVAAVAGFDDFARLMEVMRAGVLGNGRRLAKIGAVVEILAETATAETGGASLAFHDLAIRKASRS